MIGRSYHITRKTLSKRNQRTTAASENKWYQLFAGTLIGFSNLDDKKIAEANGCIPPEWQVANNNPLPEDSNKQNSSSWLETILDALGDIRRFICYFKAQIKLIFLFRFKKMIRRKSRILLDTTPEATTEKTTTPETSTENIDDRDQELTAVLENPKDTNYVMSSGILSWSALKEKFKSLGDFAKKKWDEVKGFAIDMWGSLKEFFLNIFNKFVSYLVPAQYQEPLRKIIDCGGKAQAVMMGIFKVVTGTIERALQIARIANGDPTAIISLIIDLICAWDKFKEGWEFFKTAWKNTDILKKYNYYGRAFGRWYAGLVLRKKLK